ncbi:MAG TPA: NADP-dependent malic enzyme [Acidilobales archaeon]|nr:MAG: malate dehydrogenase [Thermoprotei archaeon]HDD26660.1 NADP-dependent malic enzyme [Acidilobales archaeon]
MPDESKAEVFKKSLKLHRAYRGKIEVVPKVPIESHGDFAIWYTPGVAEVSRRVLEDPDKSFELTLRWNYIAVVSDGSRVLGLGNVGPEAALPVMEGKALLFKYLGGVDAVPIVTRARDPDELVWFVKSLEPSFGGINLEDIESPKCFYVLERLRELLKIPVWHDDQQGTALVTLAALINAFKVVGKDLRKAKIVLVGLGAANYSILKYLGIYGVDLGNVIAVERPGIGILHREHPMIEEFKVKAPHWYDAALRTNRECVKGGIPEALKGADAVIAASRPGPGIIKKGWVRLMNDDPIVFALANPVPEIWPWEAKEGGAKVVATGRSDFPNQVNNSLGFPAVFRGALTVKAKKITDEMCIAAANALAKYAEERGIHEEYIIPRMSEVDAYVAEAVAVAEKAMEQGVARWSLTRTELKSEIEELIMRSRRYMERALRYGIISTE